MKREYVKPEFFCEEFVVSEYIAACWNIACNVPTGFGYYEKNGRSGYQEDGDEKIVSSGLYGCGTKHEAHGINAEGPEANAMWQPQKYSGGILFGEYKNDGEPYEVFYFNAKGEKWGASNHHFCTLDSVNWEKNPNASN